VAEEIAMNSFTIALAFIAILAFEAAIGYCVAKFELEL